MRIRQKVPVRSGPEPQQFLYCRYSKHDLVPFKFDSFLGWIRKDLIGRILIRIHPERKILNPQDWLYLVVECALPQASGENVIREDRLMIWSQGSVIRVQQMEHIVREQALPYQPCPFLPLQLLDRNHETRLSEEARRMEEVVREHLLKEQSVPALSSS
jgi:hypothetical protein